MLIFLLRIASSPLFGSGWPPFSSPRQRIENSLNPPWLQPHSSSKETLLLKWRSLDPANERAYLETLLLDRPVHWADPCCATSPPLPDHQARCYLPEFGR